VIRFSIPSFLQASFEISSEMFDAGKHAHDRKLAQGTETFVLHLAGNILQQVDVFLAGFAFFNPIGDVAHPVRALAARGAFTAGFVFEEVHCAVHKVADIHRFIEDDNRG
jgi:hypothetical protein